jgi:hypothetical protein
MRISPELFAELKEAIDAVGGITDGASMRNRWDTLWASRYDVSKLYRAGLDDGHIDTALRRMTKLSV